jgi:hypothetical protein
LINGQRAFHTKILSTRALVATTDAPPSPRVSPPICDRAATNSRPSRNQSATVLQPNCDRVATIRDRHNSPERTPPELAEAIASRLFGVSSPSSRAERAFFCPESGTIEHVTPQLVSAGPSKLAQGQLDTALPWTRSTRRT